MKKISVSNPRAICQSLIFVLVIALVTLFVSRVFAHEFWLEPDTFLPSSGQQISVNIHVGENFKGPTFPYLRDSFHYFKKMERGQPSPVSGLDGDDPAAKIIFGSSGLAIITLHNKPLSVKFEQWEKFIAYLRKEGLRDIPARHLQAGKPKSGVKELYARAAKLLIDVGGQGEGVDIYTGMPLELVAKRNPYCLKINEQIPIQLLFKGKPLSDTQITAISKARPEKRYAVRTDLVGRALITLNFEGPWLLNAVHILEPEQGQDAHWFSLWASLVFELPKMKSRGSDCKR